MNGTFSLAAFKYIQNVQMMNTSANHAAPGAFHYTIIAVALGKLRYWIYFIWRVLKGGIKPETSL